jgi:hypothetical protein
MKFHLRKMLFWAALHCLLLPAGSLCAEQESPSSGFLSLSEAIQTTLTEFHSTPKGKLHPSGVKSKPGPPSLRAVSPMGLKLGPDSLPALDY